MKISESRKFSIRVENTVGKGEIACYEQFLLFPQCLQKASFLETSKGVIVWEWVNTLPDDKISPLSKLKAFTDNFDLAQIAKFFSNGVETIVDKGENAGFHHFLLFPQCFQKACFSGS